MYSWPGRAFGPSGLALEASEEGVDVRVGEQVNRRTGPPPAHAGQIGGGAIGWAGGGGASSANAVAAPRINIALTAAPANKDRGRTTFELLGQAFFSRTQRIGKLSDRCPAGYRDGPGSPTSGRMGPRSRSTSQFTSSYSRTSRTSHGYGVYTLPLGPPPLSDPRRLAL